MTPDTAFQDLFTHVVGDMARAIATRPGETEARCQTRMAAAIRMILAFLPRDGVEAMLAGHCVMLHELQIDALRGAWRDTDETGKGEKEVLRLNRALLATLDRLRRYQARPAEGTRDMPAEAPKPYV